MPVRWPRRPRGGCDYDSGGRRARTAEPRRQHVFRAGLIPVRLLVTRPAHPGARTAEKLKTRRHQVLLAPLLRTEPVTQIDIGEGEFEALVFTSANAVSAFVDHPRAGELTALPVFVV